MDDNERLRQIMGKMKEIEEIAKSIDTNECDLKLLVEARAQTQSFYRALRHTLIQPGRDEIIRTADGGYIFRGKRYRPSPISYGY